MNFIVSVAGKLHCTFERITNCSGKSQITVLEAILSLRKVIPGFCKNGIIDFSNIWTFSYEDLDFTNFSFGLPEIILFVLIKRETVAEITSKSYATNSILFQGEFLYIEYHMSKLN